MPPRPGEVLNEDADMQAAAQRGLTKGSRLLAGAATNRFMRRGGTNTGRNTQTGPGSLRRATGRLARSLIGARQDRGSEEGIFDLTPTRGGTRLTFGSEVPYAAIHEHGGTQQVTAKQRRFFWAKAIETEKDKWKAMALSDTLEFPERPYLRPALEATIGDIVGIVEDEAVKEIIGGSS